MDGQRVIIERRLPMGFVGDWGKVFKRFNADKILLVDEKNIIEHQKEFYVSLEQNVQFKRAENLNRETKQSLFGGEADSGIMVVKTSDSYYDNKKKQWRCIADPRDIVLVFGQRWLVKKIYNDCINDLAHHYIYYMTLENI